MKYSYEELAKMIDHSLLHPTMTDAELEAGCQLAAKYNVASVCIKPYAVKQADGKYSYQGATEHDLQLMRASCSPHVQVKAAGGVRDLDGLIRVRDLGGTRCGATATAAMLDDYRRREASGEAETGEAQLGKGGY